MIFTNRMGVASHQSFPGGIHFQKQTMSIEDTPLKINMEPKNEGLVQMILLSGAKC